MFFKVTIVRFSLDPVSMVFSSSVWSEINYFFKLKIRVFYNVMCFVVAVMAK